MKVNVGDQGTDNSAVGTRDALLAIQTDAQVARRFEPLELPRPYPSGGEVGPDRRQRAKRVSNGAP
jgi:hypothetical protein